MPVKTRDIFLKDIERIDAFKGQSNVRELEMLVDAVLPPEHQGYCGQFFYDVRVYGLSEAHTYLVKFLAVKIPTPNPEQVLAMNRVAIKKDEVLAMFI